MLFRVDTKLNPWLASVLSALPFVASIGLYLTISAARYAENPDDKIVPTPAKIVSGIQRSFGVNSSDEIQIVADTLASGKRFFMALGIVFMAIPLGVIMACFPFWECLLYRFLIFFDKIPAIALLPILFIAFGLGELSKIALIVIGVFPTVALDAYLRGKSIPEEQFQKAQSLGASGFETAWIVFLPQIFPRMLDTIRLNFKSMMGLLLVAEALAASAGLGYRIFVVRRYMAMDVIIPYVFWMTLLLFIADYAFQYWISRYRWLDKN
jgi:NitT/TauT family transport system permease protein